MNQETGGAGAALPQTGDDRAAVAMVRADLITAIVFIVLGAAILYASWTMPRLEVRRIHPMTVPGLVPGLLSFALLVCGGILAWRSVRAPAPRGWLILRETALSHEAVRALVVAALALVYTLGLVGTLPFWAATAVFVFAFILVFEVWLAEPRKSWRTSLPWALGLAVVIAAVVTLVFERAFLVRLP
jgi:uncharacterized membrane protein YwaF